MSMKPGSPTTLNILMIKGGEQTGQNNFMVGGKFAAGGRCYHRCFPAISLTFPGETSDFSRYQS